MTHQSVAGIIRFPHADAHGNDQLLFIAKRIEGGTMGGRWEFPGGKVEENENLVQTLIREFDEEFSLPVSVGEKIVQAEFMHDGKKVLLHAFEVFFPQSAGIPQDCILSEHTEVLWASIHDIQSLYFVDSDLLLLDGIEQWLAK